MKGSSRFNGDVEPDSIPEFDSVSILESEEAHEPSVVLRSLAFALNLNFFSRLNIGNLESFDVLLSSGETSYVDESSGSPRECTGVANFPNLAELGSSRNDRSIVESDL